VLATFVLAPRLARLRERFPEISLDLVVTPQILDLARDVDLSLRLTKPTEGNATVRRAGGLTLSVFAPTSGATARILAAARDPSALASAPLDVIAFGDHFIRHGENAWIEALPAARVVFHTTSIGAAYAAARAGLGLALLPDTMAAADPSLARVPGLPSRTRDLWLVTHPDLAKSPRVQAVSTFIIEAIADAEATCAGPTPTSPPP
jgi:DNA-binding transcriptional LysR family regulator